MTHTTKTAAYHITGEAHTSSTLVYKGQEIILDDTYEHLDGLLWGMYPDVDDSRDFTPEQIQAAKDSWYVHLTDSQVSDLKKDRIEELCTSFWTRFVQDTSKDITFICRSKGYVKVSFEDFLEEVTVQALDTDTPVQDIIDTYTVADISDADITREHIKTTVEDLDITYPLQSAWNDLFEKTFVSDEEVVDHLVERCDTNDVNFFDEDFATYLSQEIKDILV